HPSDARSNAWDSRGETSDCGSEDVELQRLSTPHSARSRPVKSELSIPGPCLPSSAARSSSYALACLAGRRRAPLEKGRGRGGPAFEAALGLAPTVDSPSDACGDRRHTLA